VPLIFGPLEKFCFSPEKMHLRREERESVFFVFLPEGRVFYARAAVEERLPENL